MTTPRDTTQDPHFSMIKTVVRHSAIYGFFDMLGKATALVLVPLYVRALTPADFGTLEIFVVTQQLLLALLVLGFNSALVRYYSAAESDTERRDIFRTAFTAVLVVSALVGLLLMALAPAASQLAFGDPARISHWRVVFLTVILDAVGVMFLSLFRAQERPYRYSWINLARFVIILGLNVVLVGVLHLGVKGALIGNLIGASGGALLGWMLAFRECGIGLDRTRLRQLTDFGLPLVVNAIGITFVMGSANRYILKAFGTLSDVGIYTLGHKVGMVMSVLVNAFVVAWLPILFRIAREADARTILSRVFTYYLLVTGFVLIAVTSYRHEIVALIAKPEYAGASGVILLILCAYLLQGVYYILSAGAVVTDRTRWISMVAAIGAVVSLGVNFALIPVWGIRGAAWAALISYLVLAVLMRRVSERHYPMPLELRRLGLLLGGMAAVLAVNMLVLDGSSPGAILARLLPLGLYPLYLRWAGFFSAEERVRLRGMIRRVAGQRSPSV